MMELRRKSPEPLPDAILQKQESQTEDFLEILRQIKQKQPNGKLLEIGCCTGHFLAQARMAGFEAVGVEPDPWSAEYARQKFDLHVTENSFPGHDFADQSFDVVGMFHTLEHMTLPVAALREVHRILKDTGLLAVEVPIIDTLFPRVLGRLHRHFVFDHTLFLSRRLAVELLGKAGFTVVHAELTGRRLSLKRLAWAQRKTTENFGRFLEKTFDLLHIEERSVHVNLRDNYRLYCRKSP
jgi:SAM-dependent methyltransferase